MRGGRGQSNAATPPERCVVIHYVRHRGQHNIESFVFMHTP